MRGSALPQSTGHRGRERDEFRPARASAKTRDALSRPCTLRSRTNCPRKAVVAPEIALAIFHTAIRDGFAKRFCVHSVIQGRGAPAELGRVNRERAELRANVEQPWRLIFGSVGQDVAQDSNLLHAVAQRIANPIREIR